MIAQTMTLIEIRSFTPEESEDFEAKKRPKPKRKELPLYRRLVNNILTKPGINLREGVALEFESKEEDCIDAEIQVVRTAEKRRTGIMNELRRKRIPVNTSVLRDGEGKARLLIRRRD